MDLTGLPRNMDVSGLPRVVPRPAPPGSIPLIAVEGTAYECGRQYAEIVRAKYPGYREYLDQAYGWAALNAESKKLVESHAPHLFELYRGVIDGAGPRQSAPPSPAKTGCTAFALHPSVTLDGIPISGQTKDTYLGRLALYIVLRMRIIGAPTILTLCYPGEIIGYGMWLPGLCRFRHNMYAKPSAKTSPLNNGVLALACMSCRTVHQAVELICRYGGAGAGGLLMSDSQGDAVAVDTTAGGAGFVWARDGVLTRSNHPEALEGVPFAEYPCKGAQEDSHYRTHGLRRLLEAERGRLTPQKALAIMADHSVYPRGPCKHWNEDGDTTTCFVMCEPTKGLLHAVRGQPCCNWPVTYTV